VARRRDARRLAVEILYQAELGRRPALEILEERRALGARSSGFAQDLVRGVTEHLDELDGRIGAHAEGWTVSRMPAVDRTLLRVACYEMLFRQDVPAGVAIDEAVQAAKDLSTEASGRFINGVLGRIARETNGAG
jgi:transcription antitermination protein NusB